MATKNTDDQEAAAAVKEAAWWYTQAGLTLLATFLAGTFLGWQLWGSGASGAPALRTRVVTMDQEINRVKNEREDCQKVLQVTQGRQATLEKDIAALRAKAEAAPAAH